MANVNIFEKYGIKEVANVYFEALESDPKNNVYAGDIVLYLDTLKVSTIEQTAENVAAQGGWGNPRLVVWDYGKEINLTLEDALLSLESLRFMMGGAIKTKQNLNGGEMWLHRTEEATVGSDKKIPLPVDHITGRTLKPRTYKGHPIRVLNLTQGWRTQIDYEHNSNGTASGTDGNADYYEIPTSNGASNSTVAFVNEAMFGDADKQTPKAGDKIRFFWDEKITANDTETDMVEVTISPSTFPGTYKVVGDTFMRNSKGTDEAFQFIIPKAKVLSDVTITLEAEGDPSTFEMQLQVLREGSDEMMKLVRYTVDYSASSDVGSDWGSFST